MHEPGSRETARRRARRVALVCDGERHELAEGDAVTFDADLPHHFENPGTRPRRAARRRRRRTAKELTRCPGRCSTRSGTPTRSPPGLLYIDLHLVHEVTSPQAFEACGSPAARCAGPDRTLATADHNVPDRRHAGRRADQDELSRVQVETLERNCAEFGIPIYSLAPTARASCTSSARSSA